MEAAIIRQTLQARADSAKDEMRRMPADLADNPGRIDELASRMCQLDNMQLLIERSLCVLDYREARLEVDRRLVPVSALKREIAELDQRERVILSNASAARDAELRAMVERGLLPKEVLDPSLDSSLSAHTRRKLADFSGGPNHAFASAYAVAGGRAVKSELDTKRLELSDAESKLRIARVHLDEAARACGIDPSAEQ